MGPSSQIEAKCWLCPQTFKTRRQLKNHMAAAPHKRLSLICVWCPEEKTYRRMVDLKDHIWNTHRSRIELMPSSFLTENNGFWMSAYPDSYAKVIRPSNENSIEAMKARIEVLDFLSKVEKTSRNREQWIEGWKCPKEQILDDVDDNKEATKRPYSPSRPNMYEGMEIQLVNVGLGNTYAIFRLDLEVTIRDYQVMLKDDVLKEAKMLDALVRRMTALIHTTYTETGTFSITLDEDVRKSIGKVTAKKLSIKEEYIDRIRTTEEHFPIKRQRLDKPLSPLQTPSTSDIVLDLEENQSNAEKEISKVTLHKKKKHGEKVKSEKKKEVKSKKDDNKKSSYPSYDECQKVATKHQDRERKEKKNKQKEGTTIDTELKDKDLNLDQEIELKQQGNETHDSQKKNRQKEGTTTDIQLKDKDHEIQLEHGNETQDSQSEKEQGHEEQEIQDLIKVPQIEENGTTENEEPPQSPDVNLEMNTTQGEINEKETQIIYFATRVEDNKENREERVRENEQLQEYGQKLEDERKRREITQQIEQRMLQLEKEEEQERTRLEQENRKKWAHMQNKDRARNLLRTGGMPLFPAGRREWDEDEIITLITIPTTIKWPPKNWKQMSPDQKYFNWEYASIAVQITVGTPLQISKEELLAKFNFLALPGTKIPTVEEDKTCQVKSRFYLYSVLKQIIKNNTADSTTGKTLDMIEMALTLRDTSLDKLIQTIDNAKIQLRLGDD